MDRIYFDIDDIPGTLSVWGKNFTRNSSAAFANLTLQNAIRLVAIVGAYALLIRPILVKIGVNIQAKQHREANERAEEEAKAKLSANKLRGVPIPGVDSDSEDEEETKQGQWGRKARVRQRNVVRKALIAKEEHGLGDESDEELRDLLHD